MYRESSPLVVNNPAHRPTTSQTSVNKPFIFNSDRAIRQFVRLNHRRQKESFPVRFPIQIHVLPPIKYLKDIFDCRIFTMFGHASLLLVIIIIHVIYKIPRYEILPMDEIPQVTHHRSIAPLVVPTVPHQSLN